MSTSLPFRSNAGPAAGRSRTGLIRTAIAAGFAALGFGLSSAPAAADGYAAYTVYTYNGTPRGMAGRIRDSGGSSITPIRNLKTGLNADPQVEGVTLSGGGLRIAVTNRVAPPGAVPPTNIYNATPAGTSPSLFAPTWTNVRNMYGLVRVGSYLYALDYDNARVVEINPTNFTQTGVTYTLPASLTPSGYVAHAQAITEIGGKLYGLFTFADSSWSSYANSMVVRFTLTGGSSITVGANDRNSGFVGNGFKLAVNGADLYVAGLGGAQVGGSYNVNSKLQKIAHGAVNLTTATVTNVLAPSAANPYEIRDISFKGSTAYVLWGAYDSGFQMRGKLTSTTNYTSFTTINSFTAGAPGYYWAAQYTPENDRIWFVRGNQILVYTAASPATPAATLSLTAGSLISTGDGYDNINDFTYVGATSGAAVAIRGYRSPTQISQSPRGQAAREIAQGRPELTPAERRQVEQELSRSSTGQ
ncbi:hypothetical protein [Methylopila sp. M107]|uniref:hypothetical protein n=1 Tax=Methylopila sp. M107 TaxID=1101190 RepID=UPI00036BB8D7|nr:hypothetical protein [Methylopila sp. M107]